MLNVKFQIQKIFFDLHYTFEKYISNFQTFFISVFNLTFNIYNLKLGKKFVLFFRTISKNA